MNYSDEKTRLLIADDDEGVLFLLADCLRRENYEVVDVDSGTKALEWLTQNRADLLLLDLKLGDLPASQLVDRLRAQGRNFPFIVVTGHGDERSAVEVMKQGALDYVMKDTGMLHLLPGIVRRAMVIIKRERELARANAAVREREERLQNIIQTAFDGFVRFDANGRFLEANEAFCEMAGYSREELLTNDPSTLECGITPDYLRERVDELAETGVQHFFASFKRRDSHHYEVELSIRADGDQYIGFVHDLSELRRLERQTLQISHDERNRIGNELHDGLGQQLTAIELMSHSLARGLERTDPTQAKLAGKITGYIQNAVTLTRQLAHGLSPVAEGDDGLVAALSDLARMTMATGVECEFKYDTTAKVADANVAGHLYRIAQEAVTNALKHGAPREIQIRLKDTGSRIELSIKDNGCGLSKNAAQKNGMGLRLIQHRGTLIGGKIAVHSSRGKGVEIVCSLPKLP